MKTLAIMVGATLFAVGGVASAQVGPAPAVGTGSPAGNTVTGTTGSVTTPSASGDRARTGRNALDSAPNATITGTTGVTPPPIAATPPATTGTSVNGDGSMTTPGTVGTAGTPPR